MYFRTTFSTNDLSLDFRDVELLHFDYGGLHSITVDLRPPTEGEQWKDRITQHTVLCVVSSQQDAPEDVLQVFEGLVQRQPPKGYQGPDIGNDGLIKENHVLPHRYMPEAFQSFVNQVGPEMTDLANQIVNILRWRYAQPGGHRSLSQEKAEFSFDAAGWYSMPHRISAELSLRGDVRVSSLVQGEIDSLVKAGAREPLAHELYREARAQQGVNPRSALLIGIAAAEVGFKHFVADAAPNAAWLIVEISSPPLVSMLKNYLPQLPARNTFGGEVLPPPKSVRSVLDEAVSLRNDVAHRGRKPVVHPNFVRKTLDAVQDVLWLLDYYQGHDWALEYLRPETLSELKNGAPSKQFSGDPPNYRS